MTRISFAETRLEGAPPVRGWRPMAARSRDATRSGARAALRRRARCWKGTLFSILALGTLFPVLGQAAPRNVTIRWNPSTSEGVVGYVLSVGTSYRSYTSSMTLSNPKISGDVWSKTVQLEDSVAQHLALRAVNDSGQYSDYSNEIVVAAAEGPDFGVTALQGIQSEQPVSGVIFVEALADGGTESVEFKLDGVLFRIESDPPYGFNGSDGSGSVMGWDTNGVPNGSHIISATGYSQDGAAGQAGRGVSVPFEVYNEPLGVPGKPVLMLD